MKKSTNLIIFMILFLITISVVFVNDTIDKSRYDSNFGMNQSIFIVLPDNSDISQKQMNDIFAAANRNKVIMEKIVTMDIGDAENFRVHYVSLPDMKAFSKYFTVRYNVRPDNASKLILTISTKSNLQMGVIPDFLNNDKHAYGLLEDYFKTNAYSGSLRVMYKASPDFDKFISETSVILGIQAKELISTAISSSGNAINQIVNYALIAISILIIFLFFTMIFEIFSESSRMGVFKLFGFSNFRVFRKYFMDYLWKYLLMSFFLLLGSLILIRNITGSLMLIIIVCYSIVFMVVTFILAISVYLIIRSIHLSDLIKHRKLTKNIIVINTLFKVMTLALIGILSLTLISSYQISNNRRQEIKSFDQYDDYYVFADFNMGNDDFTGSSDGFDLAQIELYKYLRENDNAIFADFSVFRCIWDKTPELCYILPYMTATVDDNYINTLQLQNEKGTTIYLENTLSKNYSLLIPISNKADTEAIVAMYSKNLAYKKAAIDVLYYKDQFVPTLSPKTAYQQKYLVQSPIMSIITSGNIGNFRSLQTIGNSYDTPMKISIIREKEKWFSSIKDELKVLGLDDNVDIRNLKKINEIFQDELSTIQIQLNMIGMALLLLFAIYTSIIMQNIILAIKNESKRITVKKLFGFTDMKVMNKYLLVNFFTSLITLIIVSFIPFASVSILTRIIFVVDLSVFEFLISLFFIKNKLRGVLNKMIKGEDL